MPALRIEVDGVDLVTVNLDGMHLLHASVGSSLHEEAPANLEVNGGTYDDGVNGHRIWISDKLLVAGQSVKVSLIECDGPFDQGQTMREVFPEEESEAFDFTLTDAWAEELRARPQLRDSFSMTVEKSAGPRCSVDSDPQNDQFSFMVLWEKTRPLQARLSVRTYCFEDVIAQQNGKDHLRDTLAVGESATCLVA